MMVVGRSATRQRDGEEEEEVRDCDATGSSASGHDSLSSNLPTVRTRALLILTFPTTHLLGFPNRETLKNRISLLGHARLKAVGAIVARHAEHRARDIVRQPAYEETQHPPQLVHVRRGGRDVVSEARDEARQGQGETDDEGDDGAQVDAVRVVVARGGGAGEEVRAVQVAAAHEEVVDEQDGDDGALEDGVAAEEGEEGVGGRDDAPAGVGIRVSERVVWGGWRG